MGSQYIYPATTGRGECKVANSDKIEISYLIKINPCGIPVQRAAKWWFSIAGCSSCLQTASLYYLSHFVSVFDCFPTQINTLWQPLRSRQTNLRPYMMEGGGAIALSQSIHFHQYSLIHIVLLGREKTLNTSGDVRQALEFLASDFTVSGGCHLPVGTMPPMHP